ncbi:MAG: DUF4381 family protein [Pseudomonadota bacterium]
MKRIPWHVRARAPARPHRTWLATITMLTAMLAPSLTPASDRAATADGAVERVSRGPVSAELGLSDTSPALGATVVLTLRVTAEPDVELLMPEFGESLGRFAILDYAPQTTIRPDGSTVATQAYELLLQRSGPQHVPPLLIEFVDRRAGATPAPAGEDAYELLSAPLRFTVAASDSEREDLSGPMGPLEPRSLIEREPAAVGGLVLLGLALIATLGIAVWRWRRRPETPESAYARAVAALESLGARDSVADVDRFFVELSGLLRRYVEGRFGLHAPELTTEEFLLAAREATALTHEDRDFLGSFLQMADRVKFAGFTPDSADIGEALAAVRQFVERTGNAHLAQPVSGARAPEAGHA